MLRTSHVKLSLGRAVQAPMQHVRFMNGSRSTQTIATGNVKTYVAAASLVAGIGAWWYIGKPDIVPMLETQPIQHLTTESDPSKAEVTRMLSEGAYSVLAKHVRGVKRYDGAQLASNSPCEDRFTHGLVLPWCNGSPWLALAVFDGHAGWQTADVLEKELIPSIRQNLTTMESPSLKDYTPELERELHAAIMEAFVNLDDSIIKAAEAASESDLPLHEKVRRFAPAFAGSCALLSLFDPATSRLHVACTGDSRAVLGRQGPDGKWEAVPLSTDQTGRNVGEVARLTAEHPGEDDLAQDGRILGLAVSRAFGDGRWKWTSDVMQEYSRRFCGPGVLPPKYKIQTPPYLTAEPVITTTTIDPDRPSFLILATDGMWDRLSNQQAVDLVAAWLESPVSSGSEARCNKLEPSPSYAPFDFGEFWKEVSPAFVEERTTLQDDNAAVHLMRNSLGGNHSEMIAGRLALTPPYSRNRRDDVTIQVLFFDNATTKSKM